MDQFSYILTIFFMLLGPVKLIPSFAGLTRGADGRFKRDVAIRGAVIASALCAFVALAGGGLSWASIASPLTRCESQEDWSC
ncbi:MAG: hypothetical protein ABSB32_08455 [Thermodesulfobacteriota bacterium]|jgi:multiple antibiotic resistance protein